MEGVSGQQHSKAQGSSQGKVSALEGRDPQSSYLTRGDMEACKVGPYEELPTKGTCKNAELAVEWNYSCYSQ
jgi:hypothetical protein